LIIDNLFAMAPPPEGGEGGGIMSTLLMFAFIIGIFYFLILRPQQKKQKERQQMLSALHKGDKIVTAGGVHGVIVGMDEKTLLVQIADNVKVKIERGSISQVAKEADAVAATKE
jgi:preprotein translocase subunit YajC